ncbi:hypothetical protein AMTR_s00087p00144660 [Amborella trichopoda]|uniref:Uncharacterized protein n=1 Tax=Amborella trichopoda TaxID=13333 RepID=W1P6J0_AMBTC|nr:hypothetical protein AMTR_s00087p00144660 [Amborella trichopoda]
MFTLIWVPPVIRVDYEVEYSLNMALWSVEWEARHALIYELSEEHVMVSRAMYGDRYWAYAREIMYMSTRAREIMERLGIGSPDELASREVVHHRCRL